LLPAQSTPAGLLACWPLLLACWAYLLICSPHLRPTPTSHTLPLQLVCFFLFTLLTIWTQRHPK